MEEEFKRTTLQHLRKIIQFQDEKVKILQNYQKAIGNKNVAHSIKQIYKEQNEELTNAITDANDKLHQSKV